MSYMNLIIPSVTLCCSSDPQCEIVASHTLIIDADCIHLNIDWLVCPIHHSQRIFHFVTNWWRKHGGTFETNATIQKAYCSKCKINYKINTWSYRG